MADAPEARGGAFATAAPIIAVLLASAFWAATWPVARGLYDTVPPATLALSRWAVALLILLPFTARALWVHRAVIREDFWKLLFLASTGVTGFSFLIFKGLQTTTALNGSLINTTTPMYIVLLSLIGIGERARPRQILGVVVALPGLAVLVTHGELLRLLTLELVEGDLWVLGAMFVWALYNIFLRQWPTRLPPIVFVSASAIFGVAVMAPLCVAEFALGLYPTLNARSIGGALYLGLGASIAAYLCWNFGVRRIGAASASLFQYTIPVFAAVLAISFLGETIHTYHLVGAALIAVGIYIANRGLQDLARARAGGRP